jgi:outer membrane autotransporter protein
VVAGPHQYLVRYVANYGGGTDDGYFLQSAARDELVAHAGLLSAGQSLIRGCFRDDQRIPDSPKGATYGRAWFGYRQGNSTFGADTGVEQDQDYSCTTGGMDWRMGHGWFGGVSGGFGSSDSDIVVPSGVGKIDGDARLIEAYAAFTSSAFFLNLSAGYADMDWTYLSQYGGGLASSGGFVGSAQAGVGLGLEPIAVKLIGMVSYDGTNCGEDCFGCAVSEDTGLIEAKGALRFDGVTWGGSIRPWAQVAYSTILSDGVNTITAGPYTIVSDTNDELLTLDAGLQSYLDENLALYLDGGYQESLGKDISGYRASIGAKLYW